MKDKIEIRGITSKCNYPDNIDYCYCKEVCETDRLVIPECKPSICSIIQVCVNVCIKDIKCINTIAGKKLIINAVKYIKIIYVAKDCSQSVHSCHFEIPFCTFILLKNCNFRVNDVFKALEYVSVYKTNSRTVYVSSVLVFCPCIKKCICECVDNDNKYIDSCIDETDTCSFENSEEDECCNYNRGIYYKENQVYIE